MVEITTETNVSELFFIFIVFYQEHMNTSYELLASIYTPWIPPFCAEIVAHTKTRP